MYDMVWAGLWYHIDQINGENEEAINPWLERFDFVFRWILRKNELRWSRMKSYAVYTESRAYRAPLVSLSSPLGSSPLGVWVYLFCAPVLPSRYIPSYAIHYPGYTAKDVQKLKSRITIYDRIEKNTKEENSALNATIARERGPLFSWSTLARLFRKRSLAHSTAGDKSKAKRDKDTAKKAISSSQSWSYFENEIVNNAIKSKKRRLSKSRRKS